MTGRSIRLHNGEQRLPTHPPYCLSLSLPTCPHRTCSLSTGLSACLHIHGAGPRAIRLFHVSKQALGVRRRELGVRRELVGGGAETGCRVEQG